MIFICSVLESRIHLFHLSNVFVPIANFTSQQLVVTVRNTNTHACVTNARMHTSRMHTHFVCLSGWLAGCLSFRMYTSRLYVCLRTLCGCRTARAS